eukprot:gnl/TRDRNA2_/TRDRNA2_204048_c0_seq1.p1 gnl/TRDRNA2_/TRDRNA2_204048_c0~~gnl/TRDRNA2_/TRDRNA2_204048_c0_seq1.p1  ORF type:complete len:318 (+),score=24.56 gnl/TRDRNA2_/TRDRNA2_204048_c0_seq1:80-955(+)
MPTDPGAVGWSGTTLLRCSHDGAAAESEIYLRRAMRLLPREREIHNSLALALQYQGRATEAGAVIDAAVAAGVLPSSQLRCAHVNPAMPDRAWYRGDETECVRRVVDSVRDASHLLRNEFRTWRQSRPSDEATMPEGLHDPHKAPWTWLVVLPPNTAAVESRRGRECATASAPAACGIIAAVDPRWTTADAATAEVEGGAKIAEAQYSILAPGAHIRPHVGPRNDRLTLQLVLASPRDGSAEIRVGDSAPRPYVEDTVFVFNDGYDHEVANRGNTERVVFTFTFECPDLLR